MRRAPKANSEGLLYPFFVVQFMASDPTGDESMWVATNQYLGDSVACINMIERLNRQVKHCGHGETRPINSAAFSVAINGTEARLYISWKHGELDYYTANVKSFLLHEPKHYLDFRADVLNIIDWRKHERLDEIRNALDSLIDKDRTKTPDSSDVAYSQLSTSVDSEATSSNGSKTNQALIPGQAAAAAAAAVTGAKPYYRNPRIKW